MRGATLYEYRCTVWAHSAASDGSSGQNIYVLRSTVPGRRELPPAMTRPETDHEVVERYDPNHGSSEPLSLPSSRVVVVVHAHEPGPQFETDKARYMMTRPKRPCSTTMTMTGQS